jgi:hypothetical protein
MQHLEQDRLTMRPLVISAAVALGLVLGATACGSASPVVHSSGPGAATTTASPSPALTADKLVCKQFTDDSNTGQVLDETGIVELLGQYPAVSPALARDYQAVGNATTLHSGLTGQIHMAADCAIVGVGRIPNTTWPPGS